MANFTFPGALGQEFKPPTEYLGNPFFGGIYSPVNQERLDRATKFGQEQAEAIAAGQQAAQDVATKMENDAKEKARRDREQEKTNRFNMLVDLFKPKSAEQRLKEGELREAEKERLGRQKVRQIAQDDAEYRARELMNKMEGWRKEREAPPALVELGKDYFGRSIMTNKPASTAEEQAKRIQQYNLSPGSPSEYAMGGLPAGATPEQIAAGKEQIVSKDVQNMINESMLRRKEILGSPDTGWTYNRALGRYTKSSPTANNQQPLKLISPSGNKFNTKPGTSLGV
jgi:hypothetical protein